MSEEEAVIQLEAILFALGPLNHAELPEVLGIPAGECERVLAALVTARRESGIVVVDDGRVVELRSASAAGARIERLRKEALGREIGRAGQETLAAVLYRGPLTRSEIDFIRGVNSSQILRTLTARGLVRRIPNPKDERSFLYEPTTELLAHLGVQSTHDLPDYQSVREKLSALEATYRAQQESESADL